MSAAFDDPPYRMSFVEFLDAENGSDLGEFNIRVCDPFAAIA